MPTTTSRYRHRALAELDRLVALAEDARARLLADVAAAAAAAAGDATGRAEALLELAEERLADLRRSRAALLADEGTGPA